MVSYAANANLSTSGPPNYFPNTGFPLSKFNSPAVTMLLLEVSETNAETTDLATSNSAGGWCTFGDDLGGVRYNDTASEPTACMATGQFADLTTTSNPQFVCPAPRHNNGSNYLLCDGHVKWLPGSKVSAGGTNASGNLSDPGSGPSAFPTAAATGYSAVAITFSPF